MQIITSLVAGIYGVSGDPEINTPKFISPSGTTKEGLFLRMANKQEIIDLNRMTNKQEIIDLHLNNVNLC